MRASYNWLKELSGVDAGPDEVARRLTGAGLEVEATEAHGEGLERVVVAEVRGKRRHEKRDKLSLVTVFDGEGEHEVVCGAPNVPEAGGRVLFARLGAALPVGFTIEERKIGGVVSRGMICSEAELDIGVAEAGIVILGDEHPAVPGTPVAEALGLGDTVFEIGLTPNRPDCLGHVGLARDLSLLFGRPFTPPVAEPPRRVAGGIPASSGAPTMDLASGWRGAVPATEVLASGLPALAVDIADAERCPRYAAGLVSGVQAGARSPFWLRYRLHLLGLRSVSAIVDATNLVMLEWGHPIHAFDLRSVRGSRIVIRCAAEGEKMATLDHVDRAYTADDLLICDAEGPVAVAGVMGGVDSEIGDGTEHVLIECAYFDPRSVRRTARRLGLHTDASHRFERGVDPNAVPAVMARAVSLIQRLAGGVAAGTAIDAYPRKVEPQKVTLRPERGERLLGMSVSRAEMRRVLEGVGCTVEDGPGDALEALVPTFRPDMGREVDLIEEVARIRGYDGIPAELPRIKPSAEGTHPRIPFARRAREVAQAIGLYEVINYAFVSPKDLALAKVSSAVVRIANPLSEERSVMRTSLLPGLLTDARHAHRRQVSRVRLFELARTFRARDEDPLPEERSMLAVLLSGPREQWIGDDAPYDFYDGKGILTALLTALTGHAPETVLAAPGQFPSLHPRRSAAVRLADATLGAVGELHPDVAEAFEVPGAVYGEIDLERLYETTVAQGVPRARPLPRFPSVSRDIAMVVDETHPAGTIARALFAASSGLAEDVSLFDQYRGDPVPEGRRSLAFRIVYRDSAATLTDSRVDGVHRRVAEAAERLFGASLR